MILFYASETVGEMVLEIFYNAQHKITNFSINRNYPKEIKRET